MKYIHTAFTLQNDEASSVMFRLEKEKKSDEKGHCMTQLKFLWKSMSKMMGKSRSIVNKFKHLQTPYDHA